jgi:hypothetical protein
MFMVDCMVKGGEGPCRGLQDPIRGLYGYFISVVYFFPRQVKVLTLARRASLNASSKEAAVLGVASLEPVAFLRAV